MALSMQGSIRTVFKRESESLMVRHHRRGKERDRRHPLTNNCMTKAEQSIHTVEELSAAPIEVIRLKAWISTFSDFRGLSGDADCSSFFRLALMLGLTFLSGFVFDWSIVRRRARFSS